MSRRPIRCFRRRKAPTTIVPHLVQIAATTRSGSSPVGLPNFIIIGAMKAGTTSLALYLDGHPQGFVSKPKEPGFFDKPHLSRTARDDYEKLFAGAGDARAVGEASTNYTKAPRMRGVPERMRALIPEVRLIYLVRDPIARIKSMYRHEVGQGWARQPLRDLVFTDPKYLDLSRYSYQIGLYQEVFQRQQICVLRTADLGEARERTLSRIAEFLSIDDTWDVEKTSRRYNAGGKWRRLPKIAHRLQTSRKLRGVRRATPGILRRFMRKGLERPIPEDATALTPEMEAHIRAILRPDHERLASDFNLEFPF